jgi:hypothetical protein
MTKPNETSNEPSDDYKQGQKDAGKGTVETVFNDVVVNHPDSDDYYAGRNNEAPPDDKDDNEDGDKKSDSDEKSDDEKK